MELSPEQKKAIEQQKEQCIFCQIASGKVESKKVYEDKQVIGVLDINPASKGHVLLMPKEHYPIMPIIPSDTFKHLIDKMKEVDRCVKEALLCKETTILIANGPAAGQQSTHFMLHIIPRESGDGLENLDVSGKQATDEELKEVAEKMGYPLKAMLSRNLAAMGYIKPVPGSDLPPKMTKEQILQVIESNPQLKEIITKSPSEFKKLVPHHAQLSNIFKDVDVDEIIKIVSKKSEKPGKLGLDDALK